MIARAAQNAFKDTTNFFFYTFFIIKKRLLSKTILFTLLGISVLFVGMAAVFNYVFANFSNEFEIAARFLGFEFAYQIAFASTATAAIFLLISFISSDIIEQKVTRSIELIITSIKPSITMISLILSYLIVLSVIGAWALGNIYLAQHFFHNYFLDSISLFPQNISFHNFLVGIAILGGNFVAPSNAFAGASNDALVTWNPDTQSFGWYVISSGGIQNFGFSSLNAFYVENAQLFKKGLDIFIVICIHYCILLLIFAYFSCIIAGVMNSSQDLQYALFPIYIIVGVPFAIYPFLRNQSEDLSSIFSYIPGFNASFYLSSAINGSFSEINRLAFLIPELGLLIILIFMAPNMYKLGILNTSNTSFFKQILFLFKTIFFRNIGYFKIRSIYKENVKAEKERMQKELIELKKKNEESLEIMDKETEDLSNKLP